MLSFAHSQLDVNKAQSNLSRNGQSFKNTQIQEGEIPKTENVYSSLNDSAQNGNFSHHNYCNIGPVLGDVVTKSKDFLPPPPPDSLLLYSQGQSVEVPNYHISRKNYFT